MARLSDFLERFRPTGVPGAAAPAGVPTDYAATRSAELDPVFAALAEARRECDAIRAQGERDAARIVERAHEEAAAVVTAARVEAGAERARASAEARRTIVAESRDTAASGLAEAELIRHRAAEHMDTLTNRAVALVRALGEEPPPRPRPVERTADARGKS